MIIFYSSLALPSGALSHQPSDETVEPVGDPLEMTFGLSVMNSYGRKMPAEKNIE